MDTYEIIFILCRSKLCEILRRTLTVYFEQDLSRTECIEFTELLIIAIEPGPKSEDHVTL